MVQPSDDGLQNIRAGIEKPAGPGGGIRPTPRWPPLRSSV